MINLMQGDCLERMKEIPDGSIDMVLTDPPPQVCVQGVMYFEETLTPVYDVNSLNPTKCKD